MCDPLTAAVDMLLDQLGEVEGYLIAETIFRIQQFVQLLRKKVCDSEAYHNGVVTDSTPS